MKIMKVQSAKCKIQNAKCKIQTRRRSPFHVSRFTFHTLVSYFLLAGLFFAGIAHAGVGYIVGMEDNLVYTDLAEASSVREGTVLEIRQSMSWGEEIPIGRIKILQVFAGMSVGTVSILRPGATLSTLDKVYTELSEGEDFSAPIPSSPPNPKDARTKQRKSPGVSWHIVGIEYNLVYTELTEQHGVRAGTVLEIRRSMAWGEEIPIGRIKILQVFDDMSVGTVSTLRPGATLSTSDKVYVELSEEENFGLPIPDAPPEQAKFSRTMGSKIRCFIPGWEQMHRNEKLKGGMILGLEVAAITSAVVFQKISDDAYDDYLTIPTDSKANIERIRQSFDKSDKNLKISQGLFATAGIVYLYNLIDGYFLGYASRHGSSKPGINLSMHLHPKSVALRWTIPF